MREAGLIMRGVYTWSNTTVKEKVGSSAGGAIFFLL